MNKLLLINFLGENTIKGVSFALDKAIYGIAQSVYKAFNYLANATLLDNSIVEDFTRRIYAILGIVMLFVLAFNLLNYIIDPDKINDKSKGASSLIKDIIIALVLLTIIPMIFTKLYSLQNKILTSDVLSNLILGGYTDEDAPSYDDYTLAVQNGGKYNSLTDYYISTGGYSMVANVFTTFLQPAGDNYFTSLQCNESEYSNTDYCKAYKSVKENGDLNAFSDLITNDDYNYSYLISTVAGVVLTFFMLSFCINLAKRAGKMAILQLIAPIPIVLELLPNKKGTRKTWIETLIKSYLEVFFFMAVIYIVVFLISLIPSVVNNVFSTASDESFFMRVIVMILLIFGLLQFGKEAPQMIFDLLGIKSTGVIKAAGLRGIAMAGALTAGVGAGLTSGVRGATQTASNVSKAKGWGRLGALGSGTVRTFTGAVGGLAAGTYMNRKNGFKNIRGTTSSAVNSTLNWQRHISQKIPNISKDSLAQGASNLRTSLGNYGNSIKNASSFGAGVKNAFAPAGQALKSSSIGKWATGDSYGAFNSTLQSYNQYKKVFDSAKVKTGADDRYMSYQRQLDQLLQENGMSDFYDKSKAYINNHDGATLDSYLKSSDFINDFANGAHIAGDIKNLDSAMKLREQSMKLGKKDDLLVAVAQAKALIDTNADIAKIAKDQGIDINSISISSGSSDADIIAAYDKLNALNKAINNKTTDIRTQIAANEIREKNKGNSSGSGKK